MPDRRFRIRGRVLRDVTGEGLAGLRVEAWDNDLFVDDLVGSAITEVGGGFEISFDRGYFSELFLDRRPDLYFKVFRGDILVTSTKDVTMWNVEAGDTPVTITVSAEEGLAGDGRRLVEGTIVFEHGQPAQQLDLLLLSRGLGDERARLGATRTDDDGFYAIGYEPDQHDNFEIHAVPDEGETIPLSRPKFHPAEREVLNLVAPSTIRAYPPEYDRLRADLRPHLGELELADLREDDERRDISVLSRASRWDARLIGLAAIAARLSADDELGVGPEALYALLRVGLPTDKAMLAQVGEDAVTLGLKKAVEANIVALEPEEQAAVARRFASVAAKVGLSIPAPGSDSTYAALLDASGLDEDDQGKFASAFVGQAGDADALWAAASDAGLDREKIQRLQLQGKIAHLVGNSEPLVRYFMLPEPQDPRELVARDFDRAERWQAEIEDLAGKDPAAQARLVPAAYVADTPEQRVAAYADDMARKLRISYPTEVVARTIEREDDDAFGLGDDASATAALLRKAASDGFRLGQTRVAPFLDAHPDVTAAVEPARLESAREGVEALQRVYQVTPDDETMQILMGDGLTSAASITAIPREQFVARYEKRISALGGAALVHRKAQQVNSVAANVIAMAGRLESEVRPRVMEEPETDAHEELVKHFPTLSSLFGSLDYCECEHCRSVLSPAAYLVDLLQFLNPDREVWNAFLADWRESHGGTAYTERYEKPYDALLRRRPDIAHIPLTCENTNTIVPYVDLVNEIIERHVADMADAPPDGGPPDDTDPTQVETRAYTTLAKAHYPLPLPFDLWLATVRRFAAYFDTPLWKLLEIFAPGDRATIALESVGIGRRDRRVLATPPENWHTLYGYSNPAEARDELRQAETLMRALGLTYGELVRVVGTRFANPGLAELALLDRLGVSVRDALFYRDNKDLLENPPDSPSAEEQQRLDELKAFRDRLRALDEEFDIDVETWFEGLLAKGALDRVLLLTAKTGCSVADTVLQYPTGQGVDAPALLRINLLVRLAGMLDWSFEDLDRALATFGDNGLEKAVVAIADLTALADRLDIAPEGRARLLVLCGDMPEWLYRELLLDTSRQTRDPIFESPVGRYLEFLDGDDFKPFSWNPELEEDPVTGNVPLATHMPALQAGLQLSAEEVALIVEDPSAAPLSLAVVSKLYRHRLLADALELSVAELLALAELSGLNPFAQALAFVEAAEALKGAGLTVAELEYLMLDRDPDSAFGVDDGAVLSALSQEIRAIRAAHAVPDDPATFPLERLQTELGLLLAPDIAARFVDLLSGKGDDRQAFFNSYLVKDPKRDWGFFAGATAFDALFGDPVDHVERNRLLATTFLPRVQKRLTRTLVLQTLTAATAADPDLVEALLVDPALLALDGQPLEAAFAATGERVVDVLMTDAAGPIPAMAEVDTAPLGAGVTRAVFECNVEMPEAATYRFSAEGAATVVGKLDINGATLFDRALGAGSRALIRLEAGRAHRLRVEFTGLDQGHARLLVEGGSVPKGGLGQLILYGIDAPARAERAMALLRKALRLANALDLQPSELRHFASKGLAIGALKFHQVLRLLRYARIEREIGATRDELVDVLAAADAASAHARLAALTSRRPEAVAAAAKALGQGTAVPTLAKLERLWKALKATGRFGVEPAALRRWTRVVTAGDEELMEIARDVTATIRARFDRDGWRRVAGPIFDELRRRRRDALVAYVTESLGRAGPNDLYEHFLVDPGMEPVVETSRIRLAIASVQLFIQRCLLNLEKRVPPPAINARQWEWMKRYRVWEANRKIFLYPENWLEPEFRDDKTHLFRQLESALLQGDVSDALVEDAFFAYLTGLDDLARLEIVGTHIEGGADPARRVLHVVGRTYGQPHKYFYRRYANGEWTPWDPITVDVEGEHVAPVVWRDRLYLFWISFLAKPQPQTNTIYRPADAVPVNQPLRTLEFQLHWCERAGDAWVGRRSGPLVPVHRRVSYRIEEPLTVNERFDPTASIIHTSKELDPDGSEGGLFVSVGGGKDGVEQSFYLAGRNSVPERIHAKTRKPAPANPYVATAIRATRYAGNGAFQVSFRRRVSTRPDVQPTVATPSILARGSGQGGFTVVLNNNKLRLPGPELSTITAEDPAAVKEVLDATREEIAALSQPVFYQDDRHTLFVEPNVVEKTVAEWQEWVVQVPAPDPGPKKPPWWPGVIVIPQLPPKIPIPWPGPRPILPIGPLSVLPPVVDRPDWLVNAATGLLVGNQVIGASGHAGLSVLAPGVAAAIGATPVMVSAASGLTAGAMVVAESPSALHSSALAGSLSIIGKAGLTSALKQQVLS